MGKREQGRWCSSCGVRLSWDDDICPHCGLPQERKRTAVPVSQVPEIVATDDTAEFLASVVPEPETAVVFDEVDDALDVDWDALVEGAIRVESDSMGDSADSMAVEDERTPRHSVVLSLIVVLAVMGGLVALVTHPWDSRTSPIGASEGADSTAVGFPGTADGSSGQGDAGKTSEPSEGDEETYAQLTKVYGKLMRYQERADGNESLLYQVAKTGTLAELTQGRRVCEALSIDVRKLLADLDKVDVSTGTYQEDLEHLVKLGGWLQKRVEALMSAWKAAEADDGWDQVRAGLQNQDTYKLLFERRCSSWEPKQR